ncbi:MAG: hypothetical protein GTN89_15640 [Acidobacteria bacterium]|nr:hypothetical protein [Acidobacteriota bacterium]NIM62401.1 hypothetical protein [Acidobacteriota bacterium]NIO60695.1 hypothetical protein [Acidobacteriota bacterium]NIQ31760.1 hypothetical protein [Acidobacteriota bacterium]NIQ87066.1 hypothetical protein [Acidobacteriota bacterium]
MPRSTRRRRLRATLSGLCVILAAASVPADEAGPATERLLTIEPSATWAGVARVHLEIEDVRQIGDVLEGTYRIRVPLSPGRNDTGRLVLHTSASLDKLGTTLATVSGDAVSSTGEVHEVDARMQPDGVVRIRVVTPWRTLRFKSRYGLH